jgi:hypothetical protein
MRNPVLGEEDLFILTSMANLAFMYWVDGLSLGYIYASDGTMKNVLSEEHPSMLTSMANQDWRPLT